jgi:hypothetical protein
MARTTRTLNPLHFEDLEPHRFEDLVRQLAYDFRPWRSIEATGRLGADEGIDIRATEEVGVEPGPAGEDDDDAAAPTGETRLWIIQCKREKKLGPADMRKIVQDALPGGGDVPHGFVVAAACDFSLKARNTFHREARGRGVQETVVWGKAELEDMLFQPRNDHLLFAYFNISLQVRRRSLRTELRSRLATKRKLISVLGEVRQQHLKPVLLRDPREERYPREEHIPDFTAFPRWGCFTFLAHTPPDHLAFIVGKFFACSDGNGWDAMFGFDDEEKPFMGDPRCRPSDDQRGEKRQVYATQWAKAPPGNRGWMYRLRFIHYDRILAIDEFGDAWYEGPHLLLSPAWEKTTIDIRGR